MKKIKNYLLVICIAVLSISLIACSKQDEVESVEPVVQEAEETAEEPVEELAEDTIGLEDGIYLAEFNTDSSMFHLNETCDGKAKLTVKDGKAVIHIVLTSRNIVNLYEGTIDNIDEAKVLQPVAEEVTYSDGITEEVNAFDVNVPYLDEEFDLALIGKKGVWYDHKVFVSNPVVYDENEEVADGEEKSDEAVKSVLVELSGGTGKTKVESPAKLTVNDKGQQIVTIVWSSSHYDYMIVNGEKILPVNTEGNSTFEVPVDNIPGSLDVIADTTAMSTPHEIEYTLTFDMVKQ